MLNKSLVRNSKAFSFYIMRILKFRAWDNLHKKMIVTGFHIFGEYTLFKLIEQYCFETKGEKSSLERYNDIVITQYTGLKDKNGKEIYEGDILTKNGVYKVKVESELEWNCGCCSDVYGWNLPRPILEYEVIGNIFENPELINNET